MSADPEWAASKERMPDKTLLGRIRRLLPDGEHYE